MAEIQIACINESTEITDAAAATVVTALQTQVHAHFARAWGVDADLRLVPRGQRPQRGLSRTAAGRPRHALGIRL